MSQLISYELCENLLLTNPVLGGCWVQLVESCKFEEIPAKDSISISKEASLNIPASKLHLICLLMGPTVENVWVRHEGWFVILRALAMYFFVKR